ncbi:MAG: amino acid adenylation domain-containing protein, partial [Actinocatenispora sp.]
LLRHHDGALLLLGVHHIVCDGWSVDVLCEHLMEAYRARVAGEVPASAESPVPVPEPDEQSRREAAEYWLGLLEGAETAALAPMPDLVREDVTPGAPAHTITTLDPTVGEGLARVAAHAQATPAIVVLTAWCLLLHAHSSLDEGVVGMPFAGRIDDDSHDEVGLYTRLLPILSRHRADQPFAELAYQLGDQVMSSLEQSEGIDDVRGLLSTPLPPYRLVFAHYVDESEDWSVGGVTVRKLEHPGETAKHDLALACTQRRGGVELRLDHDTGVYRADTVRMLVEQLGQLLTTVVAGPDRTCRQLLTALAPRRPVRTLDESRVSLCAEIRAHAAARPDAVAVRYDGTVLTYAELAARAARLSHWLRDQGVGPGRIVALAFPRGVDPVVAMVAVAFSGGAYLPMDPAYPDAQMAAVLSSARPVLVLTTADGLDRPAFADLAAYDLTAAQASAAGLPDQPPSVDLPADAVLNVLYTSGSTGQPKGVVLPHVGLARLMHEPDFLGLRDDDVIAQLSPLNFDGSTFEIWGALAHGAELVVVDKETVLDPREFRHVVRAHGITTLLLTTPLLNRVIEEAPDLLQAVRRVYFGGEMVSVPHLRRALAWCGPSVLLHSYGPTENSFTSTFWPVTGADERARTVPIGRPVPGTEAYIVFEGSLDEVPTGVTGELLLGGTGVAQGYLGNPEQSARVFLPDTFSGRPGAQLYRTGDRVRFLPDGELEFVGRRDRQIKIRSQRVELGEVEAALLTHDDVRSAFITTVLNARNEKEIVGYVVLHRPVRPEDLRSYLRDLLPSFAVPTRLALLDELPVNANGKIDRRRLPDIAPAPAAPEASPAPARIRVRERGPRPAVREVWRRVLGHDRFTDDDNFFDVGGHSLLLAALQNGLAEVSPQPPSIVDLLRRTTVRAQAAMGGDGDGEAGLPTAADVGQDDIAIVGMACRFAGSADVWEFWRNLRTGRDCMSQGAGPAVTELGNGVRRVTRHGALRDVSFDRDLFGFPGGDLAVDPQYGLMYETLWSAVENAALRMSDIAHRTSVYLGCANAERRSRGERPPESDLPVRADDVVGVDPTFLPTRFSYWHDLRGESLLLDTACSTSLVATHLACESLRSGRSDYGLAGGVSILYSDDPTYLHVPGQIFAIDGYCRPHDKRASGTVPGDGAGAVLLRRLSDAVRDGDPIYAVIRGSATNNDGRPRVGYSAPSVDGQTRVIQEAVAASGVAPTDIGFVEPHGTGTRLGDAIEAIALTTALGGEGRPVHLGGVKSSIGHTNTAAGVAGLIKTALAVNQGYIPPTLHVAEPTEELTRLGDRFRLTPEGVPWPDDDGPRFAGVSSFGVGGTNAHVVLQSPPSESRRGTDVRS